jgi:bifunctional non-homologous end joining protein LigD
MVKVEGLSTERLPFVEPMYAQPAQQLPEGEDWLYEVKLDGYRCLAGNDSRGPFLWSRRGNLFTTDFPTIAKAGEMLPPDTLVDGELVAIDETGRTSFNLLQHHRSQAHAVQLYAFDILVFRGKHVLNAPLESRRKLLAEALPKAAGPICISETFDTEPQRLIQTATRLGFEGIVAKRKGSLYVPGRRSHSWLKIKVNKCQEFVIGGYTRGVNPFDALVVGCYEAGELRYVSKVRNGFNPRLRRDVFRLFERLQRDRCPFVNLPEDRRSRWGLGLTKEEMKNCRWLEPVLVAQVEFAEWTPDGYLRHSKFAGLREDKDAREVIREGVDEPV